MPYRRKSQYTVQPYSPPEYAVRLATSRCEEMVRIYQHHQSYAWHRSSEPKPTLIDIVVSAYLQGIEDAVQGQINLERKEQSNEHKHRRSEGAGSIQRGGSEVWCGQANRRGEPEAAHAAPAEANGPHSGVEEFALSMW